MKLNVISNCRSHKLYGKSVIDGVQHPSETIYMPHNVPHAVYNLDKTTSVGNNPFFNTAIEESAFGLYRDKNYPYGVIKDSEVYIHKGRLKMFTFPKHHGTYNIQNHT